jgi:hypothetical protein
LELWERARTSSVGIRHQTAPSCAHNSLTVRLMSISRKRGLRQGIRKLKSCYWRL